MVFKSCDVKIYDQTHAIPSLLCRRLSKTRLYTKKKSPTLTSSATIWLQIPALVRKNGKLCATRLLTVTKNGTNSLTLPTQNRPGKLVLACGYLTASLSFWQRLFRFFLVVAFFIVAWRVRSREGLAHKGN